MKGLQTFKQTLCFVLFRKMLEVRLRDFRFVPFHPSFFPSLSLFFSYCFSLWLYSDCRAARRRDSGKLVNVIRSKLLILLLYHAFYLPTHAHLVCTQLAHMEKIKCVRKLYNSKANCTQWRRSFKDTYQMTIWAMYCNILAYSRLPGFTRESDMFYWWAKNWTLFTEWFYLKTWQRTIHRAFIIAYWQAQGYLTSLTASRKTLL